MSYLRNYYYYYMIAKLDIIIGLINSEVVRSLLCSGPKKAKDLPPKCI